MILPNSAELHCPHCSYPQGAPVGTYTRADAFGVPVDQTCICCSESFVVIRQDVSRIEVITNDGY